MLNWRDLLLLVGVLGEVLPPDFAWGTATSAFQVEGAWNTSGRGPSIWDYFQSFPGKISNNDTAEVATDFYNRYPSDIKILQKLGLKSFRVSISWTRIFPTGDANYPNAAGVQFYNDLFDALLESGIEPFVTLFHWDLPQAYNDLSPESTWLDPDIPNKFNAYADFCFKTFGGKIRNWVTINEIFSIAWNGYGSGIYAPGRCSLGWESRCKEVGGGGDTSNEPYIVGHNALIAHALAVKTYRSKYQRSQGGKIGMTISSPYALPYDSSNIDDYRAVEIMLAFLFGWLADPQVFGRYPPEMSDLIIGPRLPQFNASMSALIKGSYDFIGLNYYFSLYAKWTGLPGINYLTDARIMVSQTNATGHLIGPIADSKWLTVYPPGLRHLLKWIKNRYNDPEIYIFENGVSCPGEAEMTKTQALNDTFRMDYVYDHVMEMIKAVRRDKVRVKGYFLWTLMDNFEWNDGYSIKFGITHVDFAGNLTRTIKNSGYMYADLIDYLGKGEVVNKEKLYSKYVRKDSVKLRVSLLQNRK